MPSPPSSSRGICVLGRKAAGPRRCAKPRPWWNWRQHHGALIQVGHIERFNPAFEESAQRRLQPKFVLPSATALFTGRSTDIGVVLDLMIHDLDLLLALVRAAVVDVQAVGMSIFGRHEDVGQAWLRFDNGCVATVGASRASRAPCREMQVWAPEGFVRVDFSSRKLTLVQPSEEVRRQGLDPRRLDAASLARLKDELFGRHLKLLELDRNQGDQLTRELQHFVQCVRTGAAPRRECCRRQGCDCPGPAYSPMHAHAPLRTAALMAQPAHAPAGAVGAAVCPRRRPSGSLTPALTPFVFGGAAMARWQIVAGLVVALTVAGKRQKPRPSSFRKLPR